MRTSLERIIPLLAVGALLTGCGTGPAASDTATPSRSAAASSSAMASGDCSELQNRWTQGELPQEFYDGVDQGVRVVETSSGTILQNSLLASDAVHDPDASSPAAEYPDRVKPNPEWPQDSVAFIDPASGEVVKATAVPDELKCAP